MRSPSETRIEPKSVAGSPFDGVFGSEPLADHFRLQFLAGSATVSGRMDTVWHRPAPMRLVLAVLARWDTLFPETGRDIPARLRITRLADGSQRWTRQFGFERIRNFDAVISWDGPRGVVVERTGPFEVAWAISTDGPDVVVIRSGSSRLVVGGRFVSLPRFMLPRVVVVERAIGVDRIHLRLTMSFLGLGEVFGYSGTLAIRASS